MQSSTDCRASVTRRSWVMKEATVADGASLLRRLVSEVNLPSRSQRTKTVRTTLVEGRTIRCRSKFDQRCTKTSRLRNGGKVQSCCRFDQTILLRATDGKAGTQGRGSAIVANETWLRVGADGAFWVHKPVVMCARACQYHRGTLPRRHDAFTALEKGWAGGRT